MTIILECANHWNYGIFQDSRIPELHVPGIKQTKRNKQTQSINKRQYQLKQKHNKQKRKHKTTTNKKRILNKKQQHKTTNQKQQQKQKTKRQWGETTTHKKT